MCAVMYEILTNPINVIMLVFSCLLAPNTLHLDIRLGLNWTTLLSFPAARYRFHKYSVCVCVCVYVCVCVCDLYTQLCLCTFSHARSKSPTHCYVCTCETPRLPRSSQRNTSLVTSTRRMMTAKTTLLSLVVQVGLTSQVGLESQVGLPMPHT